MPKYNVTWTKLDAGREGFWAPSVWRKFIEIASNYDEQNVYSNTSPIYQDLEQAFPNLTWRKNNQGGGFHPVFRDYPHPWKYTKTLEIDDRTIRLTPLAKELLAGKISEADIFLQMFREYEEAGDKPFRIIATAFLAAQRPLLFREIFLGVMQGFRPGVDNLQEALKEASLDNTTQISTLQKRRLELFLELLERMDALIRWDDTWLAWDRPLLERIAFASASPPPDLFTSEVPALTQMPDQLTNDMALAKLTYNLALIRRYCAALLAKRFVIFTGLSGSGKTKLAQAFAEWISSSKLQLEIVSVGADWTSKDPILGYADALDSNKYFRTQALDLILRAEQEADLPFFLILDEMNLSHVERYFADLLSALESGEKLTLYSGEETREGVPPYLSSLPSNLFIIGTVNVDETTYMFSPKVLDRANTIEFRVELEEMKRFLGDPQTVDLEMLRRSGIPFAQAFVNTSKSEAYLIEEDKQKLECELTLFFGVLKECGAEFGFRTVREIARFICFHKRVTSSAWEFKTAMDAQVLQKLLPKLQGSRRKLEPILWALATLCYHEHNCNSTGEVLTSDGANISEEIKKALQLRPALDPLKTDESGKYLFSEEDAYYPLSYKKIIRMLRSLEQGFTSFAEA